MKQLILSFGLLFVFGVQNVAAAEKETSQKFNVLFLMADDWRPEIGCYGTPGMITPNLDKLAAGGVRFDRAYCQFPVCNPSRVSMLTGRYPNVTGVVFNGTDFRDLHPDWVTLPQHFKNRGFSTALAGKLFHGKFPDPISWTEVIPDGVPREFRTAASKAKPDDDDASGPPGVRFVTLEGDGESDRDYHIAANGIRLLEKYQDQPFFIGVGFHRPHAIPTAPRRFYDLYDVAKMPLPADFAPQPTLPKNMPEAALPVTNDTYMTGNDVTPQMAREVIRAYRASASWTDWNIGRVLDTLDRLGLAEKTVVVFASDHGYHNGEKGRWGKTTAFEIALRAPLIVRIPQGAGNGHVCARPMQLLDIYPTLVELCHLPPAEGVQGHSFATLLENPEASWPHAAYSMAKPNGPLGYSVRTETWHYAEWIGGTRGAILFDPARDPFELTNLAEDPANAATIVEMKALLTKTFVTMPARIADTTRPPAGKQQTPSAKSPDAK